MPGRQLECAEDGEVTDPLPADRLDESLARAAKLVRAGAGQNIYARRGLIVLRRERILINADLADGFLRRKVSA